MNVVYILHIFPKISETFILDEILNVSKSGVYVAVFSIEKPKEAFSHRAALSIHTHYFNRGGLPFKQIVAHFVRLFNNPIGYIRTLGYIVFCGKRIRKFFFFELSNINEIEKYRPDLIHAHFSEDPADIAMLYSLLTGTPFTFTSHSHDVYEFPPNNFKLKSQLCAANFTVTQYNKKYMVEQLGLKADKIQIIRPGVDLNKALASETKTGPPVIFTAARLEKEKGLDVLIRACAILWDKNIPFICKIAGDGTQSADLKALIQSLGLENHVFLLGAIDHDDVFQTMEEAVVAVLPSHTESLGVFLMEAMACHVSVIGPNVRGVPELIQNNENGYLFEPGNVVELADKIECLLSDKSLRLKLANNAHQTVAMNFNQEKETQKIIQAWKAISHAF